MLAHTAAGPIIFRTCHNCLREFETRDPDDDLCPGCYHIYLIEQCPEALAEWDDEWDGPDDSQDAIVGPVVDLSGLDDWYSVQEREDPFMQPEG